MDPLFLDLFAAAAPMGVSTTNLPLIQDTLRYLTLRQIAAHLARQNLKMAHRFELGSYHAIMVMVAAGQGRTILTPLALHHAARFLPAVEVPPLPFGPLSRALTLSARAGVLREMPGQIAGRLRGFVAAKVVAPAQIAWPWLGDQRRGL